MNKSLLVGALLALQGCVSLLPPNNPPIQQVKSDQGYRLGAASNKPIGEHQIMLAFSGGGTRAAALSYGVMQELRDTRIAVAGQPVRLLDEVDVISSVSGGSFTSAYYGLYGDDLFNNYEDEFLRRSVQGSLVDNLLSPTYWFQAMFSGINRTDMAVNFYDRSLFHGKTFADIPLDRRPFIDINATDLSNGTHFSFTQTYFDLFCSDLQQFSVARAVTASSAVPVAFPPVTLKNNAASCSLENTYLERLLAKNASVDSRAQRLIKLANGYRNAEAHPYIHLVDGGVADNLGLRTALDRNALLGTNVREWLAAKPVKTVMVILVNAEVQSAKSIDQTYQAPSIAQTAGALTDGLISQYTVETRERVRAQMQLYQQDADAAGLDVQFYFIEVDFASLDSPSLKQYFNALPTSLELSNAEIDNLIDAGRTLLRGSAQFQQFMGSHQGERVPSPKALKPCTLFSPLNCVAAGS